MATPFTDIYNVAIFKFQDYKFLEQNISVREGVLEKYLMSAATEFQRICKVDLTDVDMVNKRFNKDLDNEVIEILAIGVAYYWLSFKALNSELLKNVLNSKDYYYYSPSALLREVRTLRDDLHTEFRTRMNSYSYFDTTLDSLKNN